MTAKLQRAAADIDEEMSHLEQRARALADEYWEKHWAVRAEAERQHWGYLGVRVRMTNGAPYINWFRARYWQSRNKAGEKRSPTLDHLRKGEGYTYRESTFRRVKAKQWEIDKALELEARFGPIRRQVAMLGKMRRYLAEFRKITDQPTITDPATNTENRLESAQPTPESEPNGETPRNGIEGENGQDPQQDQQQGEQLPARRPGSAETPHHPD